MADSKRSGFTLIELVVGIAIVGALLALSVGASMGTRRSARDVKRKADLEQIRSAVEMYRSDAGGYPVGILVSGNKIQYGANVYLTIPADDNELHRYSYSGTASGYTLCAILEGVRGLCGVDECCNYAVGPPGATAETSDCANCLVPADMD